MRKHFLRAACPLLLLIFGSCGPMSSSGTLMGGPPVEVRKQAIATEATGNFFYGRRYHVEKTRFWGYLRKPRESWNTARLVMIREDRKRVPDRLPEYRTSGRTMGYDQNYEYRIEGYFTGRKAYDPNSNQILPEFMLTGYELLDTDPGWIFSPKDRYHPQRITLFPR